MKACPPGPRLQRATRPALCLLPALLLAAAACDERHDEGLKPPAILLRNVVPADSSVVEDQGGWALTLDFRSAVEADEIHIRFFPPADELSPASLSPGGRTLSVQNVDLADGNWKHRVLVDATRMRRPRILQFLVGSPPIGTIAGRLSTANAGVAPLDQTVVFAYPDDAIIDPRAPESMLAYAPVAISGIPVRSPGTVETAFAVGSLVRGQSYYIVAINDTNDDGEYDPNLDWWGYHREFGSTVPLPIAATAFATLEGRVHLRRPGPISLSAD